MDNAAADQRARAQAGGRRASWTAVVTVITDAAVQRLDSPWSGTISTTSRAIVQDSAGDRGLTCARCRMPVKRYPAGALLGGPPDKVRASRRSSR